MRVLLILALLGAATAALAADPHVLTVPAPSPTPAPSPRPSPGAGELGSPPEQQPSPAPPMPQGEQRGTQESPMVVRVLPSPKPNGEAEAEKKERDESAAVERDLTTYTGDLWLATCALAVVAAVQAGLFVWQLVLLRLSVRDAATAANAASASADAAREQAQASTRSANASEETFRLLERPYLFAFGVKELRVNTQVVGGLEPFVTYDIANHGKTPAIVENMRAGFSTGEVHPETPLRVDEDHSLVISPIMGAGEIRKNLVARLPDGIATKGLWTSNNDMIYPIRAPEIAKDWDLFYWIIVEYHGAFSHGHKSSFCWRFHEGEKLFVQYGGDEYNYVK